MPPASVVVEKNGLELPVKASEPQLAANGPHDYLTAALHQVAFTFTFAAYVC